MANGGRSRAHRRVALGAALAVALLGLYAAAQRAATSDSIATAKPLTAAQLNLLRQSTLPIGAVKLVPKPAPEAPAPAPTPALQPRARPLPRPLEAVRVPLTIEGQTGTAPRITSGSGTITKQPSGNFELALRSGERAIVSSEPARVKSAPKEIVEGEKTPLPWLVVEARSTAQGTVVRSARPFLTLGRAVQWDASKHRHLADFLFWMESEATTLEPFDSPIQARFAVSCEDIDPREAAVATPGPAGYRTIEVSCSPGVKNERAEQEIQVFADRDSLSYTFKIPHRAGPPILAADQATVYGLGFGSALLTISSVEEDGSPLKADADLPIQFFISKGAAEVDQASLSPGDQQKTAGLHPRGLGPLEVRAVLRDLSSEPIEISLTTPVLLILFMLLGGTVGGAAASLRPNQTANARRRALTIGAIEGAVVGAIISAASMFLSALSQLPSWAVRTELGIFVLSAVAGSAGTPLLHALSRVIFPWLKEKADA